MKFIKNITDTKTKKIEILKILGYTVFNPLSFYGLFCTHNKEGVVWLETDKNNYDVYEITDKEDWIYPLGCIIREKYPVRKGTVIRPLLLTDGLSTFPNIDYNRSMVAENWDKTITAYIILEKAVRKGIYNKTRAQEWNIGVITRRILKFQNDDEQSCFTIRCYLRNDYSNVYCDGSVLWYEYKDEEEKKRAMDDMKLIDTEYGFLFWQLS